LELVQLIVDSHLLQDEPFENLYQGVVILSIDLIDIHEEGLKGPFGVIDDCLGLLLLLFSLDEILNDFVSLNLNAKKVIMV
jgi:hypothetical protein